MEMTLNMLRRTHVNPNISAFTYLHGQFAYDTMPVVPFSWKMVCFEDLANRNKKAFHGVEGFSIGMCVHGFQKIRALITSTGGERKTNTFALFTPPQYTLPQPPTPEEVLLEALKKNRERCLGIGCDHNECTRTSNPQKWIATPPSRPHK